MEIFYLVDFENVGNEGIENVDSLTNKDHIHIFSTENKLNIRLDIISSLQEKVMDYQIHMVPVRKQSLDMHLVSYLGYLLGKSHSNQCTYVIISKDTDYDNIINFWKNKKENQNKNIFRKVQIPETKKNNGNNIPNSKKNNTTQTSGTNERKEQQIRTFFGRNIKDKIYVDKKEKIISIVLKEKTRQQINNQLLKLYSDGKVVKELYGKLQPLFEILRLPKT